MQQKSGTKVSHLAVCLWFLTFSRTLSESPATYVKLVDLEPFQLSMWCTNTVQLHKSTFYQSFPCGTAGTSHSQFFGEHYFLGKSVSNICEKFHHPSLNAWFPASGVPGEALKWGKLTQQLPAHVFFHVNVGDTLNRHSKICCVSGGGGEGKKKHHGCHHNRTGRYSPPMISSPPWWQVL